MTSPRLVAQWFRIPTLRVPRWAWIAIGLAVALIIFAIVRSVDSSSSAPQQPVASVAAPAPAAAPGALAAPAAQNPGVAAQPSQPVEPAVPAGVLKFENPLNLIEAKRAGNVKTGSMVQVSGTLHPAYRIRPGVVFAVYPPDVKWYGSVGAEGAVAECSNHGEVHKVENLRLGDKITIRGELSHVSDTIVPTTELAPYSGMTRMAVLTNCTIISR